MNSITKSQVSEINHLHQQLCGIAHDGLDFAIRIGELLCVASDSVARGDWPDWLSSNVKFTERTARNYMRVFRARDTLEIDNIFSLSEAYKQISDKQKNVSSVFTTKNAETLSASLPVNQQVKSFSDPKKPPTDPPIESGKSTNTTEEKRDRTGYPIPAKIQPIWEQAETEMGAVLRRISDIRSGVRKIMDSDTDNPVWRKVSANSIMVALDNAYREVNAGVPFAVCPYCQGKVSQSCTFCKSTGYVGKFEWSTAIPKELIAIRQKQCAL